MSGKRYNFQEMKWLNMDDNVSEKFLVWRGKGDEVVVKVRWGWGQCRKGRNIWGRDMNGSDTSEAGVNGKGMLIGSPKNCVKNIEGGGSIFIDSIFKGLTVI